MNEPLGYSRDGDVVTLRMTVDDWGNLLASLGAADAARLSDKAMFYRGIALLNRLNAGNPNFTPYEIPEGA